MANFLFLNIFEGDYVFLRLTSFFVFFILIFVFVALIYKEVYGYIYYAPKKESSKKTSSVSDKTINKARKQKEKTNTSGLMRSSFTRQSVFNNSRFNDSFGNEALSIALFVEMQRKNIGMRNVRRLKIGDKMYVGGGKSDEFLIFLVPLPPKLASLEYDGKTYIFKILKSDFFPYEKEREIRDSIGRVFIIVSEKGYHIYITFLPHEILCKNKGFHIKYGVC